MTEKKISLIEFIQDVFPKEVKLHPHQKAWIEYILKHKPKNIWKNDHGRTNNLR